MKNRLVIIGSGRISESHIKAAQANGFELYGICGSENSISALALAKKYNFKKYFKSVDKILSDDFDAAAIICNTRNISEIYGRLSQRKTPILAEKPFSMILSDFPKYPPENLKVLIGYNRRYYSSIARLKSILGAESFYHAVVEVSELSWNPSFSENDCKESILENSVHLLDLIFYLFGDFVDIETRHIYLNGKIKAINSTLHYSPDKIVELRISFGIPINNSITVRFENSVAECKPIEIFNSYDGMQMEPQNEKVSFKRYTPVSSKQWCLSKEDSLFKPGFYLQYQEFLKISNGLQIKIGANLNDAYKAQKLAHQLLWN